MKSSSLSIIRFVLTAVVLTVTAAACSPKEKEPVAVVNGQPITRGEFEAELARVRGTTGSVAFHGELLENLKASVLDQMIEQRLVAEQARQYSVAVSDAEVDTRMAEIAADYPAGGFDKAVRDNSVNLNEFREQIRNLLLMEKVIDGVLRQLIEPDEEEVQRFYRKHIGDFTEPERVHVRQIVVQSREEAEALRSRILKGEKFGELAAQHSLTPDRDEGGDIGTYARGQMPPEFDVAFTLKPGELSPVVPSPYGFHILSVVERLPARILTFEDVRDTARTRLAHERTERAYQNWLSELRQEAQVRIFPKVIAQIQ